MSAAAAIEPRTVTPLNAKILIQKAIEKQKPVFLWGPPGIGKSDLIWQIGMETNRMVIDIRLLLMEPSDIKGIPFYNPHSGKMEWAHPDEFPTDDDSTAILFFDELNAATQAVQGAALQLILNRRVGSYRLPKKCVMVAAGNRESDRAVTYRMPSALANRFIHYELKASFEDWLRWASAAKVHPAVVGYLNTHKDSLFRFSKDTCSRAWPSPRSWVFLSDMIDKTLTDALMTHTAVGCVGEGEGLQFMGYLRHAHLLPPAIKILTGEIKKVEAEISVKYALTTSLCYELRDQYEFCSSQGDLAPWYEMSDEFIRFLKNNFNDELIILAIRIAMKTYELDFDPTFMKEWEPFSDKYEKLILNA